MTWELRHKINKYFDKYCTSPDYVLYAVGTIGCKFKSHLLGLFLTTVFGDLSAFFVNFTAEF